MFIENKLIYLAFPYRHKDKDVVNSRVEVAKTVFSKMLAAGEIVICPVLQYNQVEHLLVTDDIFWLTLCRNILVRCDEMRVIDMDGARESIGLTDEVHFALRHDISTFYVNPELYLKEEN